MVVLEKELIKEVLVGWGPTGCCEGKGALEGGGGMVAALGAAGVAARVLERNLVLRGEGPLRKSTSACNAPELLEEWFAPSSTSMLEES